MSSTWLSRQPAFLRIMMLGFLMMFCLSVLPITIYLVASEFIDLPNMKAFETIEQQLANLDFARVYQIIVTLCVFALPAMIFSLLATNSFFKYPKLISNINWRLIGLAIVLFIFSYPFIGFLYSVMQGLSFPTSWGIDEFLRKQDELESGLFLAFASDRTVIGVILTTLMMTIVPAFCEEIIFRGTFQRLLHESTRNPHIAIIISAIIFSAIHISPIGFIPRLLMGVMLGYVFYWSGNLWTSIAAHFFFNAIQIPVLFAAAKSGADGVIKTADENISVVVALISFALAATLMYFFYKTAMRNNTIDVIPVQAPEKNENILDQ